MSKILNIEYIIYEKNIEKHTCNVYVLNKKEYKDINYIYFTQKHNISQK